MMTGCMAQCTSIANLMRYCLRHACRWCICLQLVMWRMTQRHARTCCWFLTSVTTPLSRQSMLGGAS